MEIKSLRIRMFTHRLPLIAVTSIVLAAALPLNSLPHRWQWEWQPTTYYQIEADAYPYLPYYNSRGGASPPRSRQLNPSYAPQATNIQENRWTPYYHYPEQGQRKILQGNNGRRLNPLYVKSQPIGTPRSNSGNAIIPLDCKGAECCKRRERWNEAVKQCEAKSKVKVSFG